MSYVVEREIDYYTGVSKEISRVLNWLANHKKPCKSKKHLVWNGQRYDRQWEQIMRNYLQKRNGSMPPNYLNTHALYKYMGKGWTFYLVCSSNRDGSERRDSVLITDDDVLAIEYKLSMP